MSACRESRGRAALRNSQFGSICDIHFTLAIGGGGNESVDRWKLISAETVLFNVEVTSMASTSEMRRSGISAVGDRPWGTHFCNFYESREDLLDMLLSYFKAGLEENEFCVWVVSQVICVGASTQSGYGILRPGRKRPNGRWGSRSTPSHDEEAPPQHSFPA